MSDTVDEIREVARDYLRFVESMTAQHKVLNVNRLEFIRQVVGYGDRLAESLPGLSIAEWQALSELSTSHLNEMRLRAQSFGL